VAGRLDLLLQDSESPRRYEVEIQLGKTDENHIIRTIEYWDIERKLYPQYEQCAVLVAEEIMARFLNVIGLFNGTIPLIALQMSALRMGGHVGLVFTMILDELRRGLDDEDKLQEVADRGTGRLRAVRPQSPWRMNCWRWSRVRPHPHAQVQQVLYRLGGRGTAEQLRYLPTQEESLGGGARLQESEEIRKQLEEAGLDLLDYDKRWGGIGYA